MSFAARTAVTVEKTRHDLESLLARYGATQFGYMADGEGATVMFRMADRFVKFTIPLPDENEYVRTPTGNRRSADSARQAFEQAVRARWRALLLIVKAKLEAVRAGASTFEREFLADVMLPDGRTVHEFLAPQIEQAYSDGRSMPTRIQLALPEKASA